MLKGLRRACTASLVRLYYCVRVLLSHDYTYYTFLMGLGSFPEMCAGFLVICLPVLPKFVRSVFGDNLLARLGFTKFLSYFNSSPGSNNAASGSARWRNLRFMNSFAPSSNQERAAVASVDAAPARNDSGATGFVELMTDKEKADACIVRTVRIAAVDEPRRTGDFEAEFQAIHPWADDAVVSHLVMNGFDERNIGAV